MRTVLFICLLVLSSLSTAQKIVKIDPGKGIIRQLYLSEIASDIKYTKLETNDSCLISQIVKVITDEAHIFVSSHFQDYTRLLMFSKNGNFLRNIGVYGRGPGEYSSVLDFALDPVKKIIYILDPLGKVLLFNYKGNYLRTIKLEARPSNILYHDNKIWLFSAWPDYYLNEGYCILVFPPDNPGEKIYLLNRKRITVKRTQNTLIYPNNYYSVNSDKAVCFFEEKFDTLYYINNNFKITPKYVIELKNDLPLKLVTQTDFNRAIKTHNVLYDFIDTKYYLLFSVMTPNPVTRYFFAVSKTSGDVFRHNTTEDNQQMINDLDDIRLPFNLRGYSSKNVMYSSMDCYKIKEFLENLKF